MAGGYIMPNNQSDLTRQLRDILARLKRLEKVVLQGKHKTSTKAQDFSGAKGGILLLISKGYFDQRRSAPDVRDKLAENDYHYSIQVVQTTLNRFSRRKGPLVAMKDGGKKVYVKRK